MHWIEVSFSHSQRVRLGAQNTYHDIIALSAAAQCRETRQGDTTSGGRHDDLSSLHVTALDQSYFFIRHIDFMRKRKRSDSVLWQKPLHQQKCQKGKVTTQTTPQKRSITQRLRTDLGRSVGVTIATQLVWFTGFTGPTFPLTATAM